MKTYKITNNKSPIIIQNVNGPLDAIHQLLKFLCVEPREATVTLTGKNATVFGQGFCFRLTIEKIS